MPTEVQVAGKVQSSGREDPIVSDLHGGAGRDRAMRRFRGVAPIRATAAKSMKFVSHFLDSSGSWRSKEIPGPDSLSSWEACWRVFRTAAIMCDVVGRCVLSRTAGAEVNTHRRQSLFHDSSPELSAHILEEGVGR